MNTLAERYRFLHWELQFANVFEERGGFDLIVGNPPWIKVTWQKEHVIADFEPQVTLRSYGATRVEHEVLEMAKDKALYNAILEDYEAYTGLSRFLNALSCYPQLRKIQANLYKAFISHAWYVGSVNAIVGLIHETEILSEAQGKLKSEMYQRLLHFWQFRNELPLFIGVLHGKQFAASITSSNARKEACFFSISNLFHPITIDQCYAGGDAIVTPGIKSDDNKWDLRGCRQRMIRVSEIELSVFRDIFEESSAIPLFDVRLPFIHSVEIMDFLRSMTSIQTRFAQIPRTTSYMYDETKAQNEHEIEKKIGFPTKAEDVILSGPNIHVSSPLYQQPVSTFRNKQDYSRIDLTAIPDTYYPITIYKKVNPRVFPEDELGSYRSARRTWVFPMAERTLMTAIIPPQWRHINIIATERFKDIETLLEFSALTSSLPYDFLVKLLAKSHIYADTIDVLPSLASLPRQAINRTLRLNCLTSEYGKLWATGFCEDLTKDAFCQEDRRLSKWSNLTIDWNSVSPLRNEYERRMALVELDVLVAMRLGISLRDLLTIYRVQFPVLSKNETCTWFDAKGRIIYSTGSCSFAGTLAKSEWEKVKSLKSGTVEQEIEDDTMPGGPVKRTIVYQAPFDKCDRERDYEIAWKEFEKRGLNKNE